jgi:hypothetical protein
VYTADFVGIVSSKNHDGLVNTASLVIFGVLRQDLHTHNMACKYAFQHFLACKHSTVFLYMHVLAIAPLSRIGPHVLQRFQAR